MSCRRDGFTSTPFADQCFASASRTALRDTPSCRANWRSAGNFMPASVLVLQSAPARERQSRPTGVSASQSRNLSKVKNIGLKRSDHAHHTGEDQAVFLTVNGTDRTSSPYQPHPPRRRGDRLRRIIFRLRLRWYSPYHQHQRRRFAAPR